MASRTQEKRRVVHVTASHPAMRTAKTVKLALALDDVSEEQFVELMFERLDDGERTRIAKLCDRLRSAPRQLMPGEDGERLYDGAAQMPAPYRPGPNTRAAALAFAEAIESLPAPRPHVREQRALVAAFARDRQRIPSDRERAVLLGARSGQTLDDLAGALARVDATPATAAAWWGNLSEDEERELEKLVEKALGERKFFDKRRRERAQEIKLELLGVDFERQASQRFVAEGAAAIPEGVLDDVLAGRLLGLDLALLGVVLLTFATRTFHPQRERLLAWADDGATLVVSGKVSTLLRDEHWADLDWGVGVGSFGAQLAGSAERLTRAGWLVVEQDGRRSRVRLGERLLEEGARR